MTALDVIKGKLKKRFETDPRVHISIALSHPRIYLKDDPAVIKAVYPHVFRVEETSGGVPRCHIIQYADLLTGQIRIRELQED